MKRSSWWLGSVLAISAACGSSDAGDGPMGGPDASTDSGQGGGGDGGMQIASTLTSACATLQGRAIVNFNGNLGISFTEADSPYTFLGSVQFELPDGYTGAVPVPENWDGSSPRRVVAMSTPSFELHGNHCWMNAQPPAGTLVIETYRPADGIVKATFSAFPLRSCTGASVCTITGTIETTGEGVFE